MRWVGSYQKCMLEDESFLHTFALLLDEFGDQGNCYKGSYLIEMPSYHNR